LHLFLELRSNAVEKDKGGNAKSNADAKSNVNVKSNADARSNFDGKSNVEKLKPGHISHLSTRRPNAWASPRQTINANAVSQRAAIAMIIRARIDPTELPPGNVKD